MSKKNDSYWVPSGKIWLVFDLCNGDHLSRRYVWWFKTKKKAKEHIKWQKDHSKFAAELSEPVKVFIPKDT